MVTSAQHKTNFIAQHDNGREGEALIFVAHARFSTLLLGY